MDVRLPYFSLYRRRSQPDEGSPTGRLACSAASFFWLRQVLYSAT